VTLKAVVLGEKHIEKEPESAVRRDKTNIPDVQAILTVIKVWMSGIRSPESKTMTTTKETIGVSTTISFGVSHGEWVGEGGRVANSMITVALNKWRCIALPRIRRCKAYLL